MEKNHFCFRFLASRLRKFSFHSIFIAHYVARRMPCKKTQELQICKQCKKRLLQKVAILKWKKQSTIRTMLKKELKKRNSFEPAYWKNYFDERARVKVWSISSGNMTNYVRSEEQFDYFKWSKAEIK